VLRYAAPLLLSCAAIAAAGCGGGAGASATELRLEREDLVSVTHALQRAQVPVQREVASTKAAWPHVANGLPANTAAIPRVPIDAAAASAGKVVVPAPLQEAQATMLTGPGAAIAGLFRSYSGLSMRGWQMIGSAIDAIEAGTSTAARFARANVALYVESVYDGHFSLAQIGKKLRSGYRQLGGEHAFGAALTAVEVAALERVYSEATDRLYPHVGVRLGS
jgi:hypothetical protein